MIAYVSLAIWLVLVFGRHGFWLTRERDTRAMPTVPNLTPLKALPLKGEGWVGVYDAHGGHTIAATESRVIAGVGHPSPTPPLRGGAKTTETSDWPEVVAIVPARDEADVIARSLASLAAQDYPGPFQVILVDDSSSDGTDDIARALESNRIDVVRGQPLAQGWTGKLWALAQGAERAGPNPRYLWLTDADIDHAPDTLRMLVTRAEAGNLTLVSLMARLRCDSLAEHMLIPAFVFFFQMLYPFGQINRPTGPGAAAGGCMLVRRQALAAAGGIAAVRTALIDDCTLGALLKRQGPIWLGLTNRSWSIRSYRTFGSVAAMISRSAYAQLNYSPLLLAGTVLGLAVVYGVPPVVAIWGSGWARIAAGIAWALMAVAYQPMLRFYRRSPLWGIALPGIAAFYAGCTVQSAWQYARGRGGMWKGRAQAAMAR